MRLIVLRRRFFQFCKRQPNNPKQIGKKHLYPDDTNYHLLHEWTRAVCRRLPEPSRDSLGPGKSLIEKVHRISKGENSTLSVPNSDGFIQNFERTQSSQSVLRVPCGALQSSRSTKTLAHKTNYLRIVLGQSFKIKQSIFVLVTNLQQVT